MAVDPKSYPLPSIEDFMFLKPISRGAFGKVFLGHKKSVPEKVYAIKVMKKYDMVNKNMVSQVIAERDAMAVTKSPFIVQLFYSLHCQQNIFLIMEYMIGGDVKSLLAVYGFFDEDMSLIYVAEVTLALQYLHSRGIAHRDLKPDNMLISDQGHIKLTDFGLSKLQFDIGTCKQQTDLGKTPLPYSSHKMDNFRTPGQILSLKSNLGFNIPSARKVLPNSHGVDSPSSRRTYTYTPRRTPLVDVNTNSPVTRLTKPLSVRDRLLSQATLARFIPPIVNLTPTLQDSLNWSNSGSDGSPLLAESTRRLSMFSQNSTLSINNLASMAENHKGSNFRHLLISEIEKKGSMTLASELGSVNSVNTESDSVFDRSVSIDISVNKSSDSVFVKNCHDGDVKCCEKDCCNSHLKAPSRQESIMDDTPQMHRSDESVWNSYAARNLRSMRHGSYSEDSDENEAPRQRRTERRKKSSKSSCDRTNLCSEESSRNSNMWCGSETSGYSYCSDEDMEQSDDKLGCSSEGRSKKRHFDLVERSPVTKMVYNKTGLTQEICTIHLYGDEHRMKRSNLEKSSHQDLDCCTPGHRQENSVSRSEEFVDLTSENVKSDACASLCKEKTIVIPERAALRSSCCRRLSGKLRSVQQKHEKQIQENTSKKSSLDDLASALSALSSPDNSKSSVDDNKCETMDKSSEISRVLSDGVGNYSLRLDALGESGTLNRRGSSIDAMSSDSKEQSTNEYGESVPSLDDSSMDEDNASSHITATSPRTTRFRSPERLLGTLPDVVPQTPDPTSYKKDPILHTPVISGAPRPTHQSLHAHFAPRCNTPVSQTSGTACLPHTPSYGATPSRNFVKTPFKTPKSVRRGQKPDTEDERILGTPDYLAPEILHQKVHGPAVDWWALGVCMFEFLTGVPPFNDQTPDLVFQNILNRDIPWPEDDEALSDNAQCVINELLTMDPDVRPSAKGMGEMNIPPEGVEYCVNRGFAKIVTSVLTPEDVKAMPFFVDVDWNHVLDITPPFIPQPDDQHDTTYFEAKNSMQDLVVSGVDFGL